MKANDQFDMTRAVEQAREIVELEKQRETQDIVSNDGGMEQHYGKETLLCPSDSVFHKSRVFATFNNNFLCSGDSDYMVAAWNNSGTIARALLVANEAIDYAVTIAMKRPDKGCGVCADHDADHQYDCNGHHGTCNAGIRAYLEQVAARRLGFAAEEGEGK